MRRKVFYFFLSFIFFALFVFISYLVKEDFFNQLDFDLTVKIQDHLPKKVDGFFSAFSLIGSFEFTTLILVVLIVFRRQLLAFFILFIFIGVHLIEIIFKTFLDHPGPPYMFFRYDFDFIFPSSYVKPGGSYPSGHMMRTVFLSTLFLFLIWRSKKNLYFKTGGSLLILVINGIMMISRVSLGEHWMSDVVGGAILGLSGGLFTGSVLVKDGPCKGF